MRLVVFFVYLNIFSLSTLTTFVAWSVLERMGVAKLKISSHTSTSLASSFGKIRTETQPQ